MQAIYSVSAFILHSSLQQAEGEIQKIRAFSLAGVLFLTASLPLAGELDQRTFFSLEDSYQDLSLTEVVDRLRQGLPTDHKKDAYRLGNAIMRLSERHMVSPGLLLSVIETESSYRYGVVSKAGAVGLMQLLPATAAEVASKYRIYSYRSEQDLTNPEVNLELGVAYLAYLRGRFGNSLHYLAAYNMGPTALYGRIQRGNYELGAINKYVDKIQSKTFQMRQKSNAKIGSSLFRKFEKQQLLAESF